MGQITTHELCDVLEFYHQIGLKHIIMDRIANFKTSGRMSRNEKIGALTELKGNTIGDCTRCRLSKNRKHIVFGEGDPDCEIMFIGEAPGEDEDTQGRPFVGRAGQLLTNLIKKMGFRREDVYIANIVKCRPQENRNPQQDEIDTCINFLKLQIDIVSPKVIMVLGNVALQSILGSDLRISKNRGKFQEYKGIKVMPTFHPSYLLRNPKDKWLTWEDAVAVLKYLGRDVSG